MTLFVFQPLDTPIHRLNPALKIAFLVMLSLMLGYLIDPIWKTVMLIGVIAIAVTAKLPIKNYLGLLIFIGVMMIVATGYQSLFLVNPDYFKVYPHELVSQVLFHLTPKGFPVVGETALTVGSLIWMARLPLTALTGVLLLATFIHTTSLNDMLQVMSKLHAPFPAIYIAMVAFRFAPDLARQIEIIQTAQKLRGWTTETRNPIKKIRLFAPLLIPISRHTIKCIDVMTISVQNRGFGAARVTGMSSLTLRRTDLAALGVGFVLFVTMMFGIFVLNWGNL